MAAPSLPPSSIKRVGKTTFVGMLVARSRPANWAKETLLMRFVEETGASMVFIATGSAIGPFDECSPHRIYSIEVPGKCVKKAKEPVRFGSPGALE
eukprot:13067814-Alexandrium_andersonii.AAC.1